MNLKLDNDQRKELGKFFIDLSKLVVGGVILSNVLKATSDRVIFPILFGVLIVVLFLLLGLYLFRNKK